MVNQKKLLTLKLGNDKGSLSFSSRAEEEGKSNLWKLVTVNLALYRFGVQIYSSVFLGPVPKNLTDKTDPMISWGPRKK